MNKEQLAKIKESIIKLKEGLGARQAQLILYGFCALIVVFILISAYRPLAIKLQDADRQLNGLKDRLLSQRSGVSAFKKLDLKDRLMQQKEVSKAIDEITERGRALGLKFISITPKELQKGTGGNFKVLPIDFQIECAYQSLGQFLAYLELFPRTIAEIRNFSIRPRENVLPKLNVGLLLDLYMEGKDAR